MLLLVWPSWNERLTPRGERRAHPSILTVMRRIPTRRRNAPDVARVGLLIASSSTNLCCWLVSPKLVGERRGEQGVARGVPPTGIFPADLDGQFENHVLHHFRAATPAKSVVSEPRIVAAHSAAR